MIIDSGRVFKDYLTLFKLKIMIPVSLTGFTGFFLIKPYFSVDIFLVTAGILLMSMAASVLNQIQEKDTDSLMERTRRRPLPSGRISIAEAFVSFFLLIVAGAVLIYHGGDNISLLVSFVTVFWYNFVYTPLKRMTAFAVVPGALTGAFPPLIGWVAAGGLVHDREIIIIMLLFFFGQMPHFWLLLLKYGDDYVRAGLPSLTTNLPEKRIKMLIMATILITSTIAIFVNNTGIIQNDLIYTAVVIISLLLVLVFAIFVGDSKARQRVKEYSFLLNTWYLLILVLLISDKLV